MNIVFDQVYYEKNSIEYELGKKLKNKYNNLEWIEIDSHNYIPMLAKQDNKSFTQLKQHLIIGTRKTFKYVPNYKVSDWLVPYTSSGCKAMCLYCYLVCNFNKCSYLRLFVNREQILDHLLRFDSKSDTPQIYEIGSNSDLILENQVTDNLPWTIENFTQNAKGKITFPTKFDMVQPLLNLNHHGKVIFRMSVNPQLIINKVELGTSKLENRINALNLMQDAGYKCGMLIAPVILIDGWQQLYTKLIETLSISLSEKIKNNGFIEIILMTYSYVQNQINTQAFPNAINIYNEKLMTGRGRGKYCYKQEVRCEAESILKDLLKHYLPKMKIIYIS